MSDNMFFLWNSQHRLPTVSDEARRAKSEASAKAGTQPPDKMEQIAARNLLITEMQSRW